MYGTHIWLILMVNEGNVGTAVSYIHRSRVVPNHRFSNTEVWVHAGRGKSFRWLLEHKSWAQVGVSRSTWDADSRDWGVPLMASGTIPIYMGVIWEWVGPGGPILGP